MAETVEGPTVKLFSQKAREFKTNVVLPLFEKGDVEGEYYNSSVVIDSNGELIVGTLPGGSKVKSVRKNYIGCHKWGENEVNDEKYYFRPGCGHPVFQTEKCKIGVLICYERMIPEAWRVLSLQGSEIVFVVNASAGYVSENAICFLKANSALNAVYCVCVNKAGVEHVKSAKANYYGLSAIIGPRGNVLAQAAEGSESTILTTELDLDKIREARTDFFAFRDRRPELYDIISARRP